MKQYLISGLLLFILAGSSFYGYNKYSNSQLFSDQEERIFERTFIEKIYESEQQEQDNQQEDLNETQNLQSIFEKQTIQSYRISHTLKVTQTPFDLEGQIQARYITINAECDVQAKQWVKKGITEWVVSYSKIDKNGDEFDIHRNRLLIEENQGDFKYENMYSNSKGDVYEGEKKDGNIEVKIHQDRFFIVTVNDRTGQISQIKGEANVDEDEHITWITEMLVSDLMPQTLASNYNRRISENNSLGNVNVLYKSNRIQKGRIHIVKTWNQDNFVNKNKINLPKMSYKKDVYVQPRTGIVENGSSDFSFEVGRQSLMSIEGESNIEHAGQFQGTIRQSFQQYQNRKDNLSVLNREFARYKRNQQFTTLALSFNKKGMYAMGNGNNVNFQTQSFTQREHYTQGTQGQNNYFAQGYDNSQMTTLKQEQDEDLIDLMWQDIPDKQEKEENTQKLRASQLVFSQNREIGSVKVFGSHIHVDFKYNAYSDSQQVQVHTYVNHHLITTLLDLRWKNCQDINNYAIQEKKVTLFKAVFPLMGIIYIPVSASAKFHYGYTKQLKGGAGSCEFTMSPHIEAELYADGKVSALGIIDAGIYSTGKFMDVDLTFKSSQNKNQLNSSLDGNFKAFQIDIGATYTKYNCSPKRWFKSGYEDSSQNGNKLQGLHIGRHIHKLFHSIHKVISKAVGIVRKVGKVVRHGINSVIETFCQRSQGYKQIIHKSQSPYSKNLFRKSYQI